MDKNTIEYIRTKRKQYLVFLSVVGIFGIVLFIISRANNTEPAGTHVESGGFIDIYDRISSSTGEIPLKKSDNLLKNPKFLPYRIEGENLFLEKPFTFQGKNITNAVFRIKQHGNTLFSDSFFSSLPGLFCRGTVKKGSEKFMIYYCDTR